MKTYYSFWTKTFCVLFALLLTLPMLTPCYLADSPDFTDAIFAEGPLDACAINLNPYGKNPVYEIDNGATLAEVARELRTQDFESVIGFDVEGTKLFNYTSFLKSHATIPGESAKAFAENDGALLVHNHPSGNTFSATDLYTAAKYQLPQAMIISDPYVYVIGPNTTSGGVWAEDVEYLRDYYQARYDAYLAEAKTFLNNFRYRRQEALEYPDTADDGSFEWFCWHELKCGLQTHPDETPAVHYGMWASQKTVLDVAAEFGLFYLRVPTNDFDFNDARIFQTSTYGDHIDDDIGLDMLALTWSTE